MTNQAPSFIINRNEVQSGDVGPFLKRVEALGILKPDQSTAAMLRKLESAVGFSIDGYADDRRELFQVPEVRSFLQHIQQRWPYGLYFFSSDLGTLQLLVFSHIEMRVEPKAGANEICLSVPPDQLDAFLLSSLQPIIELTARLGWTQKHAMEFLSGVAVRIGIHGEDRPAVESHESKHQRHATLVASQKQVLVEFVREQQEAEGRGAVVIGPGEVDDTSGFTFLNLKRLMEMGRFDDGRELCQQVKNYDPEREFVICFVETGSLDSYVLDLDLKQPNIETNSGDDESEHMQVLEHHAELVEFGRERYLQEGRGALVLHNSEVKYLSLEKLQSIDFFAAYISLINQVKKYDPDVFVIACLCGEKSTRWYLLSVTPAPAESDHPAATS